MNIKEIYYENRIYRVPADKVKHINKVDVTEIDDDLIVYYSDQEKAWRKASFDLQKLYSNTTIISVNTGEDNIDIKVNVDDIFEIQDKKIIKVKLDAIVVCEDNKNNWTILDKNDNLYKLFMLFEQNRNKINFENRLLNTDNVV